MKRLNLYLLFLAAMALMQSCKKDFLNRPPLDAVTADQFYKSDAEIAAGTGPLYNIVWFDYNDKAFMSFGEGRGGNLSSNDRTGYIRLAVPSVDGTLLQGYKSFYKIIAQSNLTVSNILNAKGSTATQTGINTGIAECRFMRAMAYYHLVCNFGPVPIIYDNNKQLGDSGSIVRNNIEDVWKFIIMDLTYAAQNLPATFSPTGRVSKWSAEGLLAKMYLTRAGLNKTEGARSQSDLDSAKFYAADVIKNSDLSLLPNYSDLFRSATNNSSNNNRENLFALQWMPTSSPYGINNSFQAYVAFSPTITQTGDGYGAAQGASADLVKYFLDHPADSIRRRETIMFNGDFYPELNAKNGGTQVTTTNISNIKKYVIGSPADNGGKGATQAAYINTYMMRLAELYLVYAEAIMGNQAATADPEALQYFNAVRARVGLRPATSITFDSIFLEKRIETAFEGTAWDEVLRLYYFNPAKAKAYLVNQMRGNYTITYVSGTNNPKQYTFVPATNDQYFGLTDQTVYLPIPENELLNAPKLASPPAAFDFSKLPK